MIEQGYGIYWCCLPLWRWWKRKGVGIRGHLDSNEKVLYLCAEGHLDWCDFQAPPDGLAHCPNLETSGFPLLRASASALGLCSSPACCIIPCFCVFAHFSLTGPPLVPSPISDLVFLINSHSGPSLDVTRAKRYLLTSPIVLSGTSVNIFVISFSLHITALWAMAAQFLEHQDCVLVAFVPQAEPRAWKVVDSFLRNECPRGCYQGSEVA